MAILESTHWRDAARSPRFFFMDALASFPLFACLMHIALWTFLTAMAFMVFFMILERFKFTLPIFFRWLKATLAGNLRSSKAWWRS